MTARLALPVLRALLIGGLLTSSALHGQVYGAPGSGGPTWLCRWSPLTPLAELPRSLPGYGLVPLTEDRFRLSGIAAEIRFDMTGSVTLMTVIQRTGRTEYEQVDPVEYSEAELAVFSGQYRSEELDSDYRIFLEGGELKVQRGRGDPIPLRPTVADEFTLDGDRVKFTRGGRGRPESFLLDAGRVRGIRFQRLD